MPGPDLTKGAKNRTENKQHNKNNNIHNTTRTTTTKDNNNNNNTTQHNTRTQHNKTQQKMKIDIFRFKSMKEAATEAGSPAVGS